MVKQSSNARKRARKKLQKDQAHLPVNKNPNGQNSNHHNNSNHPKNKKRKRKDDNEQDEDDLLAFAQAWATNTPAALASPQKPNKKGKAVDRKPPPFPAQTGLPLPESGFLRDEDPYRESFRVAIDTAYEGLVWEGPTPSREAQVDHALAVMDEHGLFRTDVTQPAGLGAKLVPSYVTRCLLGDEGTTYRYLGLRMFSHPWNGSGQASSTKLRKALQTFQGLNEHLTERTKLHLQELKQKRQARQEPEPQIQGQSTFNVTLINKMTVHKRLREEPMFGHNKYSVGWHADSSLEHFSTIAVYHTLVPTTQQDRTSKSNKKPKHSHNHNHPPMEDWSVALRVTHDAEGPRAKRLGDITVETSAPPIAVALPSGSTYYMLDDFNMHHQHAVLAPGVASTPTIRYSSTHRLLRQGGKVQEILARCQRTVTDSMHHGPKRWRSEQLLLTELENEWLRQFFIQGSEHKDLLWGYWQKPIEELFLFWEKLEARTLEVLMLLHKATLQRCHAKGESEDRKEALAIVMQVIGDRKSAMDGIFKPVANLISERAKSRDLWAKRELDPVFHKLPKGCHPIPFPVAYGQHTKQDSGNDDQHPVAVSPLPDGSSSFLKTVATEVERWGTAFDSCSSKNLKTSILFGGSY